MVKKDSYRLFYYNGDFNMNGYYKKTWCFSTVAVLLIVIGTLLMLKLDNGLPLVLSLVIFTVSLIWFIASHAPFISALYSVFVLDEDKSLWYITVMPGRTYAGPNTAVPNVEGAIQTSRNRTYIVNFVEDIKAGRERYSIWSGGARYMKLVDYKLKKETDKFIFVEANVTTRKYKSKIKTLKFVKQYELLGTEFMVHFAGIN